MYRRKLSRTEKSDSSNYVQQISSSVIKFVTLINYKFLKYKGCKLSYNYKNENISISIPESDSKTNELFT